MVVYQPGYGLTYLILTLDVYAFIHINSAIVEIFQSETGVTAINEKPRAKIPRITPQIPASKCLITPRLGLNSTRKMSAPVLPEKAIVKVGKA